MFLSFKKWKAVPDQNKAMSPIPSSSQSEEKKVRVITDRVFLYLKNMLKANNDWCAWHQASEN